MSGEGDGFLTRWSRLKREAAEPIKPSKPAAPAPDEGKETTEATAAVDPTSFDPATLEIPLPSLEDLKPGDTLVAFMQKGVPEALRNAAMRKMWALDPMVRDFRSEALDYAYDWNTPGGVPGSGPLGPEDRVEEMVEALFRPATPVPEPEPEPTIAELTPETGQEVTEVQVIVQVDPPEPVRLGGPSETEIVPEAQPANDAADEPETEPVARRRHGGAMPQV